MAISKFPSFFKSNKPKYFNYTPRYYDKTKNDIKKEKNYKIRFKKNNRSQYTQKHRTSRILILIFILSLLFYKILTT